MTISSVKLESPGLVYPAGNHGPSCTVFGWHVVIAYPKLSQEGAEWLSLQKSCRVLVSPAGNREHPLSILHSLWLGAVVVS